MSEHTPDDVTDVTPSTKPTPDGDTKPKLSETELAAIKARDVEKQKRRDLERKLEELQGQLDAATREEAHKKGDVEALRVAMSKDIEAERKKAEAAEQRWKTSQKKAAFMGLAHRLFAESAVDDAYTLLESKLDVSDDDGDVVVRVTDSALPLEDYLKQFAENKPHLAKNKGVPGTGPIGSPRDDKKTDYTVEQLENMEPGQYRALVAKRPDLARKFLTKR